MAGVDDQLRQAVAALKAGRKEEARTLLEAIVEQDQRHEQAWFYLSAAVDSLEEQEICLENVLALNPQHVKAQQGLTSLRQKKQPPGTTRGPASAPPAGGMASGRSLPIGAEIDPFANTFDTASASVDDNVSFNWFGGSSPPESPDELPDTDPYAIPTSVDWGHSDRPPAHGSGQDVEMPSAQEWDAWVQRLNIGKDSPDSFAPPEADTGQHPFVVEEDEPFGELPYTADDGLPYVEDAGADQADESYGGPSTWFSSFGDDEPDIEQAGSDEDPFSSFNSYEAPVSPRSFAASSSYAEPAERVEDDFSFDASQHESTGDEEDFDFSFNDDDEDDIADASADRVAQAAKAAPVVLPGAEYYRLIPGEIETSTGGIERRGLLMLGGVVILLVLNLMSFAALLL